MLAFTIRARIFRYFHEPIPARMPTATIHETAVISSDADLAPSVEVGPYAVIEGDVSIGAGTVIGPHAVIRQYSRLGKNNFIDAHAIIGGTPQHTSFAGDETWVEIGDDNVIREGATIHRAFEKGGKTSVGSNCMLMINSHVAHDCTVGDNVVLTNNVMLGGHVEIGRGTIFGGASGAHQFVRVGPFCMVAGMAPLRKDVLPFTMIGGDPVRHYRLNSVGLRRNGIKGDRYRALEAAFRALRAGDKALEGVPETEEVLYLREWLGAKSKFGYYGFASAMKKRQK